MKRAIGYLRVSTSSQVDGFGPDLQSDAIHAWARAHDTELLEIFRDEGVSGTLLDRPALGSALQALQEGTVLVVARLDRLARDLITQELLLREIHHQGAELVSCAEGEQGWLSESADDPSRKLIRQVLGAVSEYERAMVSLRLRMGRARKSSEGGYTGGETPFGWRCAPDTETGLAPDEREARVLQVMIGRRRDGLSFAEIADRLNVWGVGWGPRRGTLWTKQAVHRVLARSVESGACSSSPPSARSLASSR